jgi:hypothetical protein
MTDFAKGATFLAVMMLALAGLTGAALFDVFPHPSPEERAAYTASRVIEARRVEWIDERLTAQQTVKAVLREPSSAVFGLMIPGARGMTCGVVNARNGFGGMTGDQVFTVTGSVVEFGAMRCRAADYAKR